MKKFYYGSHSIDTKDKLAILKSLDNSLSQGSVLKEFEEIQKVEGMGPKLALSLYDFLRVGKK